MSDSSACWSRLAGRLAVWTSDWPQQCSTPSAGFICEFHSSRVGTNDLCMETMSTRRRAGARCVSSPAVLTETQFVDPGNRTTLIEHVDRRAGLDWTFTGHWTLWTLDSTVNTSTVQMKHASTTAVKRFDSHDAAGELPICLGLCVSEFIIFLGSTP